MKVTYLYNIEGWAIHDIGRWMRDALAPHGVEVECVSTYAWHAHPQPTDVLHIGYSGLARLGVDYRRWARRVVVTFHDPCEISHYEDRLTWEAWPLRWLELDRFDGIGVISRQLEAAFRDRYGRAAIRTPTWPSRAAEIRAAGAGRVPDGHLRLFASTNAKSHFTVADMIDRLRMPRRFLRDEHGAISLRQLPALGVRRRRKNIPLLQRVAARAARHGEARVITGAGMVTSREAYEASLQWATVYACTSTMEGGPLPVMEAVLAGAAVVTTPVGQVADWVETGDNGFICRDEEDFSDAIRQYQQYPDLLAEHQRGSIRRSAAATPPRIAPWLELLTGQPTV